MLYNVNEIVRFSKTRSIEKNDTVCTKEECNDK
jgi:hypothetical protein